MATFAVVKDDEVTKVDHDTLEAKRLLSFPVRKTKAKARSNIVAFKLRDLKRTKNNKRANG